MLYIQYHWDLWLHGLNRGKSQDLVIWALASTLLFHRGYIIADIYGYVLTSSAVATGYASLRGLLGSLLCIMRVVQLYALPYELAPPTLASLFKQLGIVPLNHMS
jgi:hypothetical protein